jgi:hypothetical protein
MQTAGPARRANVSPMPSLAHFRADDPESLVDASLACPMCLRAPAASSLHGESTDGEVRCVCSGCGHAHSLELSDFQFLRLSLAGCPSG